MVVYPKFIQDIVKFHIPIPICLRHGYLGGNKNKLDNYDDNPTLIAKCSIIVVKIFVKLKMLYGRTMMKIGQFYNNYNVIQLWWVLSLLLSVSMQLIRNGNKKLIK